MVRKENLKEAMVGNSIFTIYFKMSI